MVGEFFTTVGPYVLWLGITWALGFATQLVRYLLSAGTLSALSAFVPPLSRRGIQRIARRPGQVRAELRASLSACAIFAALSVPVYYGEAHGFTRVYRDVDEYGLGYLLLSFPLLLVVHDTYFYWTHRWMHRRSVFGRVHRRHHESRAPTAWAALAFHPLESLVQGAIYPLMAVVIPVHIYLLAAFLVFANLHSTLIHCGHDLVFAQRKRWIAPRIFSTSLEHDAHHAGTRGNYGLYFLWWDAWMGTLQTPSSRAPRGDPSPSKRRAARKPLQPLQAN